MSVLRAGRMRRSLLLAPDQAVQFLPWVFGLMIYAAALSALGLFVLHDSLRSAQRALATTISLQVPADASPARLRTLLATLRQTPAIASVHLLDQKETARLLAPWLGSSVALDELPMPRLIDVQATPAGRIDFAALNRELSFVVPGARMEDHRRLLRGMRVAAARIDGILGAAIAVALALIAALAAFAAGAGPRADSSQLELLHLLGAADGAIARKVALRWLRLGGCGGLVGAAAALLTVLLLGDAGAVVRLPATSAAAGLGDWRLWAVLIGAVPAAGLIAMSGAGAAVLRRLARMP